MNRIVWYPTFRCNFNCPYCIYRTFEVEEVESEKWLHIFNSIEEPMWIDISGGEPFIYPGFVELLLQIPKRHKISITTNLTDVDGLKKLRKRLSAITISFHPFSWSLEEFISKVKKTKKFFKDLSVTIVAYPDLISKLDEYKTVLEKIKVRVNIEPYVYPHKRYTVEEQETVSPFLKNRTVLGWNYSAKLKECNAGREQSHWLPNGDVVACGSFVMLHLSKMDYLDSQLHFGNLFDGSLKMPTEDVKCVYPCFAGCDQDFHKKSWGDKTTQELKE